jgi:hypothetical protein
MPVSLSDLEGRSGLQGRAPLGRAGFRRTEPIDKSKFALFKPLSLDVIFHDCNIKGTPKGKFDAFAR